MRWDILLVVELDMARKAEKLRTCHFLSRFADRVLLIVLQQYDNFQRRDCFVLIFIILLYNYFASLF